MKTTFLYTLSDPETGKIRYLGKSDHPFNRYRGHLCDREKSHKTNWISSLKAKGLAPFMDLLDEVPDSQWQFWEREYIRVFRAIGINLVNGTDGGDGHSNPSPESRESCRRKQLGKPKSPETRARMRAARKGRKLTLEHRANIRAAQSGKNNHNFGKKLPHPGVPRSPECRAKISASLRAKNQGKI